MKKIVSILLIFCFVLTLCACGETPGPVSTTESTLPRSYITEESTLRSCIGQADENGVFVVPDGITEIGEGCFSGDTGLVEVVLSDSVVKIAEGAFYGCSSLKKITFGRGLKKIGGGSFQYCTALKSLAIPEGVEYVGSSAFYQCSSLSSVSFPSTLKLIDSFAFALCSKLDEITLPEGLETLGNCAFQACTGLTAVTLPKTLSELSYQVFAQCTLLSSVNLPEATGLRRIGQYAFWRCTSLKNVTLPAGLTRIDDYAFYACSKLNTVSVPSTLSSVGAFAFDLTPWYLELSDDYVVVGDGVLLKCNRTAAYLDLSGKGIKTLGGAVFRNTSGYFNGVDDYGASTYYGYSQAEYLTSIAIPEGVVRIENSAFAGCTLTEISLPTTLEYIGTSAFYEAILYGTDKVTGFSVFPKVDLAKCPNLTHIGDYAFAFCYGMDEITLPARDDISIGAYAFFRTEAMYRFLEQCYYTNNDKDAFFTIGNTLLYGYVSKDTESVVIPDGIRNIAGTAFVGWDSGLIANEGDYDTVSDSEKLFDRNRFYLGYHVKSITIPESVETIGAQAFYSMRVLESVTIPDSVKTIGDAAFMNCYEVKDITFGNGVRTIGDNAFRYCYALTAVTLPDNLVSIGNDVFDSCYALKTVYFPKDTVDVGYDLFSADCTALTALYLSPKLEGHVYGLVGSLYSASERSAFSVRYYIENE